MQLRAVLIGLSVDWLGTSLFVALLALGLDVTGIVPETEMEAFFASTAFLAFGGLVGLGFTALGGFVAAEVAGEDRMKHAAIMGVLSLILGALMMFTSSAEQDPGSALWYAILAYALPIPAAMLGGRLSLMRRGGAPGPEEGEVPGPFDPR